MEKISKTSWTKNTLKSLALVAFLSSGEVAKAVETPLSDPMKSTKLSKHIPKNEKWEILYISINDYLRAESGVEKKPDRYRELWWFVQKRFANKKWLQADEKWNFTVSLHDVVAFLDTFTIYYDENNDYVWFSVTSIEGDYAFCDTTFTSNTSIGTKAEKKMNPVTPVVHIANESKRHDPVSFIPESVSASWSEYVQKGMKFATIAWIESILQDRSGKDIVITLSAHWCGPCRKLWNDLIDFYSSYTAIKINTLNLDECDFLKEKTWINKNHHHVLPTTFIINNGIIIAEGLDPTQTLDYLKNK